jgi:uncharacterized protein YqiB (DUF1249 family)
VQREFFHGFDSAPIENICPEKVTRIGTQHRLAKAAIKAESCVLNFSCSFVSIRGLISENETVAVVYSTRLGRERAADLRPHQTGAVRRRRSQVSAFVADWLRVDAVGHGVVCVERERRTNCGFLGF